MAAIEFKNEEEYNNVNTQIQSMLDNGLNNIPSTYEAFGLNSDSFFKLDLNNDNPFELDDKFTTRARGDKGDSYSNAFKYGFKGSVASTFELLASIPGGYDRFRDWMVEFVGLEPNPDNIADHVQDYFNAIAKKFDPMQLGMDPPSTYGTKVMAGIASLPLTIAQYHPAVKLSKLTKLGKLGHSLPAGIAATEFLRSWDDASLYEIGKLTAYGAVTGQWIKMANRLQVIPRMASLGVLGFLMPGWKAPLEDRMAAATVFAAGGLISPWAEGKSLKRISDDAQLKYKQITGEYPAKEALLKKADAEKAQVVTIRAMLTKHDTASAKLEKVKRAQEKDEKFTPLTKEEKGDLIEPNKVYDLRNKLDVAEQFLDANYRALYTTKEYSVAILGADIRGPHEFKYEMIKPDGTPKYNDIPSKGFEGALKKAGLYLKPGKFLAQENPVAKWVVDTTTRYIRKGELEADQAIHDPKQIPNEHKTSLRGIKEGESLRDYITRTEGLTDALGLVATARRTYTTEKSYGAALTRFEIIMNRDPKSALKIVDTFIDGELGQMIKARENGESIKTQEVDGSYKYAIKEHELFTKYKLNTEEVLAYKDIRNSLDIAADKYNKAQEQFGEGNKSLHSFEKLPNYIPHQFTDAFNVWIVRINADGTRTPVANIGTNTTWGAKSTIKRLRKQNPFNNTDKYEINYSIRERYPFGTLDEAAFYDTLRAFNRRGLEDEAIALGKFLNQPKGWGKFTMKRKDPFVQGFKGSKLYMQGRIPSKIIAPNLTRANDFADVIKSYLRGAYSLKNKLEAKAVLREGLENAPAMDVRTSKRSKSVSELYSETVKQVKKWSNNALGLSQPQAVFKIVDNIGSRWIGESGLSAILGGANQFTLAWKLLFGNMRFIAAQAFQPYHMIFPKLVDLKYQGMNEGNIALAQVKSFRDLFFPDAEVREAIKYFKEKGLVEPKFLREFSGTSKLLALPKIEALGNYFGDFGKLGKALSLRDMSSKVEQVSRLNAGIMFYNFLRSAGKSVETSKAMARYLADQYMVEYNHYERPLIYGDAGIGTIGKPFGLFKTFSHNYLAQLVEYINTYKHTGQSAPLMAFLAQMVFAAGLFGTIAIETADTLLEKLSPTLERFTGKPIRGLKESIATSSFPDVVKFGIPSGMTGIDFTTTLASPGQSVTDLISVPTLDMWGLNPLKFWDKRALLPTVTNYLGTLIGSRSDLEQKQALVELVKAAAPTSLQFTVEQYYQGLPVGYDWLNTEMLSWIDPDAFAAYAKGPYRDPFKKSRGVFTRNAHDWLARKMAARSIEEREVIRLVYVATRVKSDLRNTLDTILTTSAHHFMRDGFIPSVYFDEALKYGEDPDAFIEKVLNRIDLQTSDFVSRILEQTKSKSHVTRLREIREIINSKYMYNR